MLPQRSDIAGYIICWFLGPGNFLAIGRFHGKICAASLLTSPTFLLTQKSKNRSFQDKPVKMTTDLQVWSSQKETWLHTGEMCKPTRWGRVRFRERFVTQFFYEAVDIFGISEISHALQCFDHPNCCHPSYFLEGILLAQHGNCVPSFRNNKSLPPCDGCWIKLCTYDDSVPETVVFELDASKEKSTWRNGAVLPTKTSVKNAWLLGGIRN